MKKIFLVFSIVFSMLLLSGCGNGGGIINSLDSKKESVEKECEEFTKRQQQYIDNKDYDGFEDHWLDHGNLSISDDCDTIDCSCPSAWSLFIENKKLIAQDYLEQGFISTAYNKMSSYIDKYDELKNFHDENNIFKILSSEQKENITGIYKSFGEWQWEYEVGGSFSFNKRIVNYGSSSLSLKFDDYNDKVLISGHMASSKHPNWNSEKNIAVEWYNYKILNNIVYLKLENETEYDAMFEIVSLTDNELQLKLLMNTTDVNAGQVYIMNYVRS